MSEKLLFDDGWLFHRGAVEVPRPNVKAFAYMSAKTECAQSGPANRSYPVRTARDYGKQPFSPDIFEKVELPHDFAAGDEADPAENEAYGFVRSREGWYIKKFTLDAADRNKRLTILFDGVAGETEVYLNSCLAARSHSGYTPFEVDITDFADFEAENTLSVHVNADKHEGWWYEGGGIFRHVWLRKTEKVSVDLWGVYVHPEKTENGWRVTPRVTVRNDDETAHAVRVICTVLDAGGREVGAGAAGAKIPARSLRELTTAANIAKPQLWSPETPYQYTLQTRVLRGNGEVDLVNVRFGLRTFAAAPEGFFINGKRYDIKGFCGHENGGVYGKVVPDNIQRYRVRLMKGCGANAYRTSHYPQSEALMDALDENGFIVMDEARLYSSEPDALSQLAALVKRDRNRPSVFFWSLGNEEPLHHTPRGARIYRTMAAFARKLDDTRLFTTAVTAAASTAPVMAETELIGINYAWAHYDPLHEKYPGKFVFATECGASGTTRGWYYPTDPARGMMSAYDTDINNAFRCRERTWKYLLETPWIAGGFHWIFADHRGEAVWPRICSQSGAVDLYYQKKDAYYQHKAYFTDEPTVHLLPHWTHPGREGEPIRVAAYTNQPRAELLLNGKSVGVCDVQPHTHAEWQVPYAPGTLTVRALDKDGRVTATDVRRTAGAPAKLELSLETPELTMGDYAVVFCRVVDKDGTEVPEAAPLVRFMAEGAGRVFSTGASPADHTTLFSPDRTLFMGRGTAFVKITAAGTVTVRAVSDGLSAAAITFEVK